MHSTTTHYLVLVLVAMAIAFWGMRTVASEVTAIIQNATNTITQVGN